MNTSGFLSSAADSGRRCDKDDLTNLYGWMVQGVLAGLAFTCLIAKRYFEPKYVRRTWETWWYDTSKQGIGALVIHMANVYLARLYQGDACTWYIINFLLDSTIGLFIVYMGIRISHYLAVTQQWSAIHFGEYTAPKSWQCQTCIYIGLMIIVKLITTLFIQLDFWTKVSDVVLSPFSNARVELFMVMLVIPFFVNILIFWVTDNFLMLHKRKPRPATVDPAQSSLFERVKIRYRALHTKPSSHLHFDDSESDVLLSDEELAHETDAPALKRLQRNSVVSLN